MKKPPQQRPHGGHDGARQDRYTTYDTFAAIYDRHWGSMFCEEAREGFQNMLLPRLPHQAEVLDLCCGTGQLAQWLTGCGFRVTGLDASEAMISRARRNAPRAKFVVADARSFRLPGAFDLVISTFDSLNHLPSEGDLLQVFENVRETVRDEGLFFFDMNMDAGFRYTWHDNFSVVESDDVCITRAEYDPQAKTGRTQVTLFARDGEAWRRHDLDIVEYCYSEEVVRSSLAKAGFGEIVTYDAQTDLGMPRGQGRLFFQAAKAG